MKEEILRLRSEGYSYRQIQHTLGCSKCTISYHCGKDSKEKFKLRASEKRVSLKGKLAKKIDNFLYDYSTFKRRKIHPDDKKSHLYDKWIENPICYLTGQTIDLENSSTYSVDHIIPKSKGGSDRFENAGLTLKEVNQAKHNLSCDEFIEMCRKVVQYQDSLSQNLND